MFANCTSRKREARTSRPVGVVNPAELLAHVVLEVNGGCKLHGFSESGMHFVYTEDGFVCCW